MSLVTSYQPDTGMAHHSAVVASQQADDKSEKNGIWADMTIFVGASTAVGLTISLIGVGLFFALGTLGVVAPPIAGAALVGALLAGVVVAIVGLPATMALSGIYLGKSTASEKKMPS